MADTWFSAKEWKARLVEFAGRRSLRNVANGETTTYDVSRSEGQVSQEGDAFNTKNMNDLEQRVANGFANAKTAVDTLNRDLGGLSFGQDADGNWGYKVGGADSVTPFKYSVLGSYIAGSSLHNMKTGWLPIDFCDTNIASLSNGELIFKKSGLLQVRIMASISVDNSLENNIVQLLVDGITHVQKNLKGTTTSIEIESSIPVSVGTRVGCKFKQETGRSFYCMSSYIING